MEVRVPDTEVSVRDMDMRVPDTEVVVPDRVVVVPDTEVVVPDKQSQADPLAHARGSVCLAGLRWETMLTPSASSSPSAAPAEAPGAPA